MTAFHLFPLLPFELRGRIWRLTVEPRIVEVRVVYRPGDRTADGRRAIGRLVSPTRPPAIVQTCREARNEMGLYERAMSEVAAREGDDPAKYVWLNWDADTVSLGDDTGLAALAPVASSVRRLRFERDNSDETFYHFESCDLRAFSRVRQITVICGGEGGIWAWHGALRDHYWPCGPENVYFIDPGAGASRPPMTGAELDAMCNRTLEEMRERYRRQAEQDNGEGGEAS
ncbi:hypothetical protein VTI28DRAFT_6601 [Corynascus sepedonium]